MITCDAKLNVGFHFDFNFEVNDVNNKYTPKQLKDIAI